VRVFDLGPLEATSLATICGDALADTELPQKLVVHFVMKSGGYPGRLLNELSKSIDQGTLMRGGPAAWKRV
jgi:hypothetical protein